MRFLRENKEGIIIGAIVGWAISRFVAPQFIDLSILTQTQGVLDPFISAGKSLTEIAKTKLTVILVVLGAGIGAAVDMAVPEGKLFKRRFR